MCDGRKVRNRLLFLWQFCSPRQKLWAPTDQLLQQSAIHASCRQYFSAEKSNVMLQFESAPVAEWETTNSEVRNWRSHLLAASLLDLCPLESFFGSICEGWSLADSLSQFMVVPEKNHLCSEKCWCWLFV